MNSNYSMSGTVDVIIKAFTDCKIAGRDYTAGEVISVFKETDMNILYSSNQKTNMSRGNLSTYSDVYPDEVTLRIPVITTGLMRLLGETNDNIIVQETILETVVVSTNAYLKHNNISNVFVYDSTYVLVTGYSIDTVTGEITGLVDGTYLVTYTIETNTVSSYYLSKPDISYLTLEIKGAAQIAGQSKRFIMVIPRGSLINPPTLSFNQASFAQTDLIFKIIEDRNKKGVELYFV